MKGGQRESARMPVLGALARRSETIQGSLRYAFWLIHLDTGLAPQSVTDCAGGRRESASPLTMRLTPCDRGRPVLASLCCEFPLWLLRFAFVVRSGPAQQPEHWSGEFSAMWVCSSVTGKVV